MNYRYKIKGTDNIYQFITNALNVDNDTDIAEAAAKDFFYFRREKGNNMPYPLVILLMEDNLSLLGEYWIRIEQCPKFIAEKQ